MPVKLSRLVSAGDGENIWLKPCEGCAALGPGALNSLVNAPGSFAGGSGGGEDGIAGAVSNIDVNDPGASLCVGSGAEELSRSGKLKMFANSSGVAGWVAGYVPGGVVGCEAGGA
jgi:hypothetical protein